MDLLKLEELLQVLTRYNVTFYNDENVKLVINNESPPVEDLTKEPDEKDTFLEPVNVFPDGIEPKFSGEK